LIQQQKKKKKKKKKSNKVNRSSYSSTVGAGRRGDQQINSLDTLEEPFGSIQSHRRSQYP
jgi:hypothetical protein